MLRVVIAFGICALGLPLVLLAFDVWSIGAPAFVSTFFGSLVLGFPTFRYFQRRSFWKLWQFILGGALLGLVCALPVLLSSARDALGAAAIFIPIGAIHAAIFWVVGIFRNQLLLRQP